jgi:hypothetical protein
MDKICVICGARFTAPPSAKKVTCGQRPCVRTNTVRTHRGVANTWNAAARQRVAQRGQTANLRQGTPAAQHSPRAGPFATNQEAKDWWVTSPVGHTYTIRNLRAWCREHPDLFAPDPWPNAYAGLRQVQAWLMGKTARMVSQWKGWTLARPAASPRTDSP